MFNCLIDRHLSPPVGFILQSETLYVENKKKRKKRGGGRQKRNIAKLLKLT
jgi:hypothetical protein